MSYNAKTEAIRISRTLIMSVVAMAVNYLISLVLTSYVTENIGAEAYGFVSLAKNISNYAIVFTGCLNAYSSRYITISYHKTETKEANTFYSSVFYANVVLSVLVITVALVFIIFLDKFLNIPKELLTEVQILLLLNFVNYMFVATGSCFAVYAYISDRLDVLNLVKFVSYSVEAIILIILFSFLKPSIVYVGMGLLASSIVLVLGNYLLMRRYVPKLKIKVLLFKLSAVKKLIVSGIWNSINSIGNLLQSGLDLIVTNLMLSAIAMGQLSVVKTLSTIFTTLFQLVATPFHPKLLRLFSKKDMQGVILTFKTSIKATGFLSTLIVAGFFAYGKIYYRLWTPTQDIEVLYILTIITFLGSVIEGIVYPLFYTYTLTLKNRIPCLVTIVSGFLNIFGMYILIKYFKWNLFAVVFTTSVLGWGTYFVFTPLYASKCLGCSLNTFYPTIIKILIAGIAMTACMYIIAYVNIIKTSWISLFCGVLIAIIICVPIYFFIVFDKGERKRVFDFVRTIGVFRKNR